jgi:aryl-alcohol dehydrogenase (NADP+)
MIPLCIDQGVGIIPWSPLARGLLTGSRTRENRRATPRAQDDPFADRWYFREEDFQVVDTLLEVSAGRGEPPAVVALAWLLSAPGVTSPIVGSTKVEHLAEAARALDVELTDEEIERLEDVYVPNSVQGHEQPTPRNMTPSQ